MDDHDIPMPPARGYATDAAQPPVARTRCPNYFELLYRISTTIAATLHLDAISGTALEQIAAALSLAEARLYLIANDQNAAALQRVWDSEGLAPLTEAMPLPDDRPEALALAGEPIVGPLPTPDGRQELWVAVRSEWRVCGALGVMTRPGVRLSDDDQRLLVDLSRPLAQAVENAWRYSEQQRAAGQLIQAEKLAAVGRLAASIAHEVNNPLYAIHNSLDLLLTHDLSEEKRQRYISMAHGETQRLIASVQRMLELARPSREGMRPTFVSELLATTLETTAAQLDRSNVRVIRDWQHDLPRVFAIRSHLRQVFVNLILNALESMSDGGTLAIRGYSIAGTRPSAHAGRVSTALVIEFSDTGCGIPAEELHKVFEPLYSTKMAGPGLGLAISYNIVQQHGGDLTVQSDEQKGTTFRLVLPAAE